MWMVDPRGMCRRHLLGEHVECHMLLGAIRRGRSLAGYVRKGLVELSALKRRHDQLAREMLHRGYRHRSPLAPGRRLPALGRVDPAEARRELARRCRECRRLQASRSGRRSKRQQRTSAATASTASQGPMLLPSA
jgi:hypothetical protein